MTQTLKRVRVEVASRLSETRFQWVLRVAAHQRQLRCVVLVNGGQRTKPAPATSLHPSFRCVLRIFWNSVLVKSSYQSTI